MKIEDKYLMRVVNRAIGIEKKRENAEDLIHFDWDRIYYQASLHRLIPVLYRDLQQQNLLSRLNNTLYKEIRLNTTHTIFMNKLLTNEAFEIVKSIRDKYKILIVKGPILSGYLYKDFNTRMYSDIDFLLEKKYLTDLKQLLKEKGYTQGFFDKQKNLVIPASRSEIIEKEVGSHETIEFHQLIGEICPIDIVVDLNFAVSWRNKIWSKNLNTEEFLNNGYTYNFNNIKLPGPKPEYLFIHTCLHHYSEEVFFCWQYSWYKNWGDIELSKYIDIAKFLLKKMDYILINKIINSNDLRDPISFILTHVKLIFPKLDIPLELNQYLCNESEVNYYYTCKEEKRYWKTLFLERIFNQKQRVNEVFAYAKKGDFAIKHKQKLIDI